MSDNHLQPPEDMEKLFKERAGTFLVEPSKDTWKRIEVRLDQRRKRRFFLWLFFGVLLIGALSYSLFPSANNGEKFSAGSSAGSSSDAKREKGKSAEINSKRDHAGSIAPVSGDLKNNKSDNPGERNSIERESVKRGNSLALSKGNQSADSKHNTTAGVKENRNTVNSRQSIVNSKQTLLHETDDSVKSNSQELFSVGNFEKENQGNAIAFLSSAEVFLDQGNRDHNPISDYSFPTIKKQDSVLAQKAESGNSRCVSRWLVSLYLGSGSNSKMVTENDSIRQIAAYRNAYDENQWSNMYGVHFTYCLLDQLRIGSGAGIFELSERMPNKQIVYHYDSLAAGPLTFVAVNSSNAFASSDTTVNSFRNNWTYLEIPALVSYRILPCSRFSLEVGAGLSLGKLIHATALVYDFSKNRYEQRSTSASEFRRNIWSWNIGIRLVYYAGKNIELAVGAEQKKIVTNIFTPDYPMTENFEKKNLLFSVSRRFGK